MKIHHFFFKNLTTEIHVYSNSRHINIVTESEYYSEHCASQSTLTTPSLTWRGGPGAGRCQTPRRPPRQTGRSRASRVQGPAEQRARGSGAPHVNCCPARLQQNFAKSPHTLTLCAAPLCCATRLVFLQRCVAESSATRI